MTKVAIYLVTYRRPALLKRALKSILVQTHRDFVVRVVNDDPADKRVDQVLDDLPDARVGLFQPAARRGGVANFNLPFAETDATFVTMLEDDNWWEPEFLERALDVLNTRRDHDIVVANQRIWQEVTDGTWKETGTTIWPTVGGTEHVYSLVELCGSAKFCNSSYLCRLPSGSRFRTPEDIPVDVTEHFRERMFEKPLLTISEPLVNFAATLSSARSSRGDVWSSYQIAMVIAAFGALRSSRAKNRLAAQLWADAKGWRVPGATKLAAAGLLNHEARALWRAAGLAVRLRLLMWFGRRPQRMLRVPQELRRISPHIGFLRDAPLTRRTAEAFEAALACGETS